MKHITIICDSPENRAFSVVLDAESRSIGFTYTLVDGVEAENYMEDIERSNAIFVSTEDLSDEVLNAIKNSEAKFIVFQKSDLHLDRGNLAFVERAREYFSVGGIQNLDGLVKLMLWVCGERIALSEVVDIPSYGVYHPRVGSYSDPKKFLRDYPFSSFLAVCLLFDRKDWLYGKASKAYNLIELLEMERIGVLPIFVDSESEKLTDLFEFIEGIGVKCVVSLTKLNEVSLNQSIPFFDFSDEEAERIILKVKESLEMR